jgi:hypothetical protein
MRTCSSDSLLQLTEEVLEDFCQLVTVLVFQEITANVVTLYTDTYEVCSSSKVSDFFSHNFEQINTCGLV